MNCLMNQLDQKSISLIKDDEKIVAENIITNNWDPTDKEILLASHLKAGIISQKPPNFVSSDVLKIIKVMGYENFGALQLPKTRFWDETQQ